MQRYCLCPVTSYTISLIALESLRDNHWACLGGSFLTGITEVGICTLREWHYSMDWVPDWLKEKWAEHCSHQPLLPNTRHCVPSTPSPGFCHLPSTPCGLGFQTVCQNKLFHKLFLSGYFVIATRKVTSPYLLWWFNENSPSKGYIFEGLAPLVCDTVSRGNMSEQADFEIKSLCHFQFALYASGLFYWCELSDFCPRCHTFSLLAYFLAMTASLSLCNRAGTKFVP
jgi:hypothetical protein